IQHAPPQRNPGDAGGISLHHVGPVAEGFVAWLFGLGALVLFIRKIGTT
ncbi:MAG: cytochrome C, partial [Candidatus Eremiobacteraeota bacterium]|nr:cytochrome C [Candidatus Eremiobacteraeota bacterium]